MEMLFWIILYWNVSGELRFSRNRQSYNGEDAGNTVGYAGPCGFSAEMERTLQVLDYAVLVINGADGVQGHTQTLWKLLKRYQIPTFLLINKMDQPGTERERILKELKKR